MMARSRNDDSGACGLPGHDVWHPPDVALALGQKIQVQRGRFLDDRKDHLAFREPAFIHSLDVALDLNLRHKTSEFLVTQGVFLQVLLERKRSKDHGFLLLNNPYDSPSYRFLHKALWHGMVFTYLSNQTLSEEMESVSSDT